MEVFTPYDQQNMFSSNRQMKNPTRKNTNYTSISRSSTENLAPFFNNNIMYGPSGGIFYGPPQGLSYSYPPPSSFNPPLLPLPISKPIGTQTLNTLTQEIPTKPYRTQSFSHTQVKKTNKPTFSKDHSLNPRKPKQPNKKEEPKKRFGTISTVPLGPDPSDLQKHVPNVLASFPANLDKFSGSVFSLSPPPSSLPLPKFSMRPKLSCNAEAAAGNVDAGATDNLRRMLRLR